MSDSSTKMIFVGMDVSKARLDLAVRPSGEQWSEDNTIEGINRLVEKLKGLQPTLIVMEATGGLEMAAAGALAGAELSVSVINPRQIRDFAKSLGRLAKTDKIDARVIAHFADAVRPEPRKLASQQAQAMQAILTRRRHLIEMLVAE